MSEQASAPSAPAGSESSSAEVATTGSTTNSSSESSGGSAPAPTGAQASQTIVNAMESAEKQSDGTFELTIDGEKVTLTLEEMKAGYQKAKASAKRFQEASEKMKQAEAREAATEERKKQLLRNPLKAMFEEGMDEGSVRKHYEEAVWQWLQQDQMTPEQKADMKAKRDHETEKQQLAREKAEMDAWKKERQAEKEAKEIDKYQQEYATQLQSALSKHNLPHNPRVVAQLVEYMKEGLSYDDTFTFEDAAQAYKEENQGSIQAYLKSLSPAQLMEHLGPDGVKAFRKQDLEVNVKTPVTAAKKPSVEAHKSKDNKISAKELFARR